MAGPEPPSTDVSDRAPTVSPRGGEFRGRSRSGPVAETVRTRISSVLAAVVGLAAVTVVGATAELWPGTLLAVACGVGFAAGVALLTAGDPVRVAAGTVVGAVAAGGLVAATLSGDPPAIAALSLASFASASIPTNGVAGDRLVDAAGVLGYALVPVGILVTLDVLLWAIGATLGETMTALSPSGLANLTVFLLALFTAVFAALAALRALPVVELTARGDRRRVRARVDAFDYGLRRGLLGVGVLLAVWFVLWALIEGGFETLESVLAVPAGVLGSPVVRIPLFAVALLGIMTAVSVRVLRWAGGSVVEITRRTTAMAVGAVFALAAIPVAEPLYRTLLTATDSGVADVVRDVGGTVGPLSTLLIVVLVAVFAFLVALLVLPAVVGLGLAPERAAAPAFAAAGLVGSAALVAGTAPAWVVLAGVVAGIVVWDLGEFGRGLDEEVEDTPATRAELVHAAGTLGVGAVVAGGAVLAHGVVTDVRVDPTTGLAALAFAFVGVALLSIVLRG